MKDIKWKSFILSEIFDITSTNNKIDINKIKNKDIDGNNPYITRTDKNNGIYGFITEQDYKLNKGNVITIGSDTQTVFYQPHSFYTGQSIQILTNDYMNKYTGLYLVSLLKIVLKKFNWGGNGATLTRLNNTRILIPIDDKGMPNYDYMEEYMKSKEKELIKKYQNYIKNIKCNGLEEEIIRSNSVKWKEFYINEIFQDIQRGKRLTKANFITGNIPYVSSSSESNGINEFIGNKENVRIFENCITLANSGSVGSTFYHPYKFVASDHVTHLKNNKFNKYIYLFLASVIKRLKSKYNFNREINNTRLKREVIILPITENGNIDYKFIEEYMKNLEEEMINKYLNYLKCKA